jgi:hypothetical protein
VCRNIFATEVMQLTVREEVCGRTTSYVVPGSQHKAAGIAALSGCTNMLMRTHVVRSIWCLCPAPDQHAPKYSLFSSTYRPAFHAGAKLAQQLLLHDEY